MPYAVSEATQYRLETAEWEASLERSRQRRHEEPVRPQRTQQTMDAQPASWVEWVDARIEEKFNVVLDIVGEALGKLFDKQHASIQEALDRRDAEIKLLKRELRSMRAEVALKLTLKTELAAAQAEIDELRQRAPSFKSELNGLREEIAKQQKIISRLRGQNSELAFVQKQLDAELSQMKRKAASPAAVVQFETSSSRITVGNLHPDAANALREFASQVVDAYDGDPILFSGPAGTA
jgi:chromosome segregation ATPase